MHPERRPRRLHWSRLIESELEAGHGTKAQTARMLRIAEREQMVCTRCARNDFIRSDYDVSGSNQYKLRLKCAGCGRLLATPKVPQE